MWIFALLSLAAVPESSVYVHAERLPVWTAPESAARTMVVGINTRLRVHRDDGDWLEVSEPVCGVRGYVRRDRVGVSQLELQQAERLARQALDREDLDGAIRWLQRALAIDGRRQDVFAKLVATRAQAGRPMASTDRVAYLQSRRIGPAVSIPGVLHGKETQAEDREVWWGLFSDNNQVHLAQVCVRVEFVYDPIYDFDHRTEATGKRVGVDGDRVPKILLRGLPGARSGAVTGKVFDDMVGAGVQHHVFLGDRGYRLAVTGNAPRPGVIENYALCLGKFGQPCQPILTAPTISDLNSVRRQVRFIGDLDRDGRPDVWVQQSDHYYEQTYRLLLSSDADDEPVVEFARQTVTAC